MNFKIHKILKGRKVNKLFVQHWLNLKKRLVWEKEARNIINHMSYVWVQAWHLCWSMSIKSSIVKCLSNAVVMVPCNCWEKTLSIAVVKYMRKKITITVTQVVLIQLFSYSVASKQKIKMKTLNTMAPSYHAKVTSTQNKGVFFLLFRS